MLRRSGCKNEKIAFIMDESNVLDSGFLERMNTLLANGEVIPDVPRGSHSMAPGSKDQPARVLFCFPGARPLRGR